MHRHAVLIAIFALLTLLLPPPLPAFGYQDRPRAVEQFQKSGIVHSVRTGEILIRHQDGEVVTYKIQDKDDDAISLNGKTILRVPAKIDVNGQLPAKLLERGMVIKLETRLNRFGKQEGVVDSISVVEADPRDYRIDFHQQSPKEKDYEPCSVIGRVANIGLKKVTLNIPKSVMAKQGRLSLKYEPDTTFKIFTDNLNRVVAGDTVNKLVGVRLSNELKIIAEIDISMTGERKKATVSFHEKLEQKHSNLSDAAKLPRELRSQHFLLVTDISDRSAAILLDKLETMYDLIAKYYSRQPESPIICFVATDLNNWSRQPIPRIGMLKILEGAGVTVSGTSRGQNRAVVYSCDDHNVVQHEAVHAFCALTFGSPGPIWYAEGMAEMGQYWQPNQLEVNVAPVVIDYLTHAPPKEMLEIVRQDEITGDSWQAYAWRWALCHLLANHPTYGPPFKRLGVQMMKNKEYTFADAFGDEADKINFEYQQFVNHFGNGYRVDLCAWQWKAPFSNESKIVELRVPAKAGWQATRLAVTAGQKYEFVAKGKWQVDRESEVDADGSETGEGQLMAAIYKDFKLSDPFPLGTRGSFEAPQDGQLYLRCQDSWLDLANNSGSLQCYFRLSQQGK